MDGIETSWPTEDQIPSEYKVFKDSGQLAERDDGQWTLKVKKVDKFRGSLVEKNEEIGKLQAQLKRFEKTAKGSISSERASELNALIEDLNERLELGEGDQRLKDELAKRLSKVTIGERSYEIAKTDRAALSEALKTRDLAEAAVQADRDDLAKELARKTLAADTRTAMDTIGGFKSKASDAVNTWVMERYQLGPDHKPYKPDLKAAAKAANGEPAPPTVDEDGNQVTIESDLRSVVKSGMYAGVWTEEPGGMPGGSHATRAVASPDDQSASAKIARGVAAQLSG